MKRIIKLTESDLHRIVKRVIEEQSIGADAIKLGKVGKLGKLSKAVPKLGKVIKDPVKLLSQLTKTGRGPTSHKAQVSKDADGNLIPDGQGMNNWQSRNAYDLMCNPGTEVRSPVNGKIKSASKSSSTNSSVYGWNVTIETDDGKDAIFMTHLDPNKTKVSKGDVVKKGDLIGYIGDPSSDEVPKTFAPHLHVSTRDESGDIFSYVNDDLSINMSVFDIGDSIMG